MIIETREGEDIEVTALKETEEVKTSRLSFDAMKYATQVEEKLESVSSDYTYCCAICQLKCFADLTNQNLCFVLHLLLCVVEQKQLIPTITFHCTNALLRSYLCLE